VVVIRLSENFVYDVLALISVHDVVALNNYHLKKVFADSELQEDSVIRNFRITAADGKNYDTKPCCHHRRRLQG
jgi:hypothetical protein